jgi:MarR family transcriptional regulator, organic hydroperoxide resistance regulator
MAKPRTQPAANLAEGDNWIDDFVPYQLYRVTSKLNAKLMGKLKAAKVNPSQWRVLSILRAYGTLNVGKLVELTLMEQPTVSRVVAQLEQEGRVERRWSSVDSRVAELTLTPAGAEALEAIIPTALRHQQLALKGFGADEIEAFTAMLSRIEANIEFYD